MEELPIIKIEVREMARQMTVARVLRDQDVSKYIEAGIKVAAETAANDISEAAADAAKKALIQAINSYFSWGEGRRAIDSAIKTALSPIVAALTGEQS